MPDPFLDPADVSGPSGPPDLLRGSLLDSRQRWRHLVSLAGDLAFETDAKGRFVFMTPDPVLGWPAATLIGQPSELLLSANGAGHVFNPFRPTVEMRGQRVWIKRHDGSMACMAFAAAPLHDAQGRIAGSRGIANDVTEYDAGATRIAASLRRGEVLDHILWCVAREVMAPRMMNAALSALVHALAAEGAAVIAALDDGRATLRHICGPDVPGVLSVAAALVAAHGTEPRHVVGLDGRQILAVGCQTRFGASAGLVVWRTAEARPWDRDDILLVGSAGSLIRMILEHETIQRDMGRLARTDPLTGLLNRRAFLEEMQRHAERLNKENAPGTLMFADMDSFKAVNDRLGHEMGDQTLIHVAKLLRDLLRPADLVARLGGDEFAVWMDGADHMTAAERADHLRLTVPGELAALLGETVPGLGLSIGIATRRAGSQEPIDSLIRRADMAMYEVKRSGRGHWRVSLLEGD